jgi:hypothetical protein
VIRGLQSSTSYASTELLYLMRFLSHAVLSHATTESTTLIPHQLYRKDKQ